MKYQGLTMYSHPAPAKRRGVPVSEDKPARQIGATETSLFSAGRLAALLGIDHSEAVDSALRAALLDPVASLTTNPGKRIRAQLVAMAYRLFHDERSVSMVAAKQCRDCAEAVELIHAGSLIIDDIEDSSAMRRGRPAMHVQYNLPLALNAGNWLYFWPFELLKDAGLTADQLVSAYERYNRTLLRAHFGQALDLGVKMAQLPQQSVAEVCLAGMTLKTGALMGFAAALGATIAGMAAPEQTLLEQFGVDIGVALQMFDDLGNVMGKCDPQKRYEDLSLARPSWVWACAANASDRYIYEAFLDAVARLPDVEPFERWLAGHNLIDVTRASARRQLERAYQRLEQGLQRAGINWSARALGELRLLGEEIAVAYG